VTFTTARALPSSAVIGLGVPFLSYSIRVCVFDADLEPSLCRLSVNSDVMEIMHAMSAPESDLEIRDRMWLKITIPNAFIGK